MNPARWSSVAHGVDPPRSARILRKDRLRNNNGCCGCGCEVAILTRHGRDSGRASPLNLDFCRNHQRQIEQDCRYANSRSGVLACIAPGRERGLARPGQRSMVTTVVLLLVAALLVYAGVGVLQRRRRSAIGLTGSTIIAADDSHISLPTLRSERLGLVGRPVQLVRIDGCLIPVEQKPRAWRVHDSHVMQLAAECLLVSEVYGVRPPYGLLVLANGERRRIPFTRELEQRLLQTLTRMNALIESNQEPGPRWLGGRCRACGYFSTCWE
jgi:CRISPR/Cas system-associated exonuclease Cas4 (RecB family)